MYTQKLHAGSPFPAINATLLNGDVITLSDIDSNTNLDWKLVVIYRGKHCPLCTKYLNELENHAAALRDLGVDIIAASADSHAQLASHLEKLTVSFPLAYGLTEAQLKELGLYISTPRSAQETDHSFAEPGLFIINQEGNIQVVDISNNPFVRPSLPELVSGIQWIRNPNNNYPIRGTFSD